MNESFVRQLKDALFLTVANKNPVVTCTDFKICFWCGNDFIYAKEYEHEPDCIWALVKESYEKGHF